jgi:hypothetical protein
MAARLVTRVGRGKVVTRWPATFAGLFTRF